MIPLKLSLRNFLSYGSKIQEIDFGPYPLICFSGKNGHGKSALLDAITWAIWGQARKVGTQAKPDAHLLRLGQTSMMACIEILCNSRRYRIKREFSLTQSAHNYSALEFGLIDEQKNTIKNLTEKTIRTTQDTIDQTLGLSFDTFVNTAFLRQGNANEFSKRSPKERKEILASILKLEQFDQLKKMAHEKSKECTQTIHFQKQRRSLIEQELEQYDTLQATKELIVHELSLLTQEETTLNQLQSTLEKQLQDFTQEHLTLKVQLDQDVQLAKELEEGHTQLLELYTKWRSTHKQLGVHQPINEEEKQKLLYELHNMQKYQEEFFALKEQFFEAQTKLKEHLHNLQSQQQQSMNKFQLIREAQTGELRKLTALLQKAEQIQHKQALELKSLANMDKELKKQLTEHISIGDQFQKISPQFEKRKQFYHRWIEYEQRLTQEIVQLDQKKTLSKDIDNPSCPLCQQELSSDQQKLLHDKFVTEQQRLQHRRTRIRSALNVLKPLLQQQHAELKELQTSINKHEALLAKQKHIEQQIQQLTNLKITTQQEIQELKKSIELIQHEVKQMQDTHGISDEQDKTGKTLQARVHQLQETIKKHTYRPDIHQALLKKRQALEQQEQLMFSLQKEHALQQQRWFQFCSLKNRLKQLKNERLKFTEKRKQAGSLSKKIDTLTAKKNLQEKQRTYLYTIKEELLQHKAHLDVTLERFEKQKIEILQVQKTLQSLEQEAADFNSLTSIFSKDGIQALLIEDTLPELEQEANALLSQLTHNQAHIMIESLRDLKKGGMKETLDIKISDAMGIRPYELFSGGEAFRIDFALRIAISKLLARRAGTTLQTLIIDEGFGSQDEEGLSLLMDTIHKIQTEFAKVIVVSHLPILKEQFPVHFMIHKTGQGSMVSVIEH